MKEMERIAESHLPAGMTFEWTDMSYQERLSSGQTALIFALALIFIYLFLVSQYESWMIPVSVLLSVPVALAGALFSLLLLSITNNIYTQVGFVLLFGIACKTAILIVEFAKEKHEEGMSISDIFETYGEEYFRELETNLLIEMQSRSNVVVSCGGGVPMRERNVVEMKKNGRVVLLTAKPETILERVKDNHDRPLLENNKNVSFIADLLEKRRAKYEAAADIVVETDGKSELEICEELIHRLREAEANK